MSDQPPPLSVISILRLFLLPSISHFLSLLIYTAHLAETRRPFSVDSRGKMLPMTKPSPPLLSWGEIEGYWSRGRGLKLEKVATKSRILPPAFLLHRYLRICSISRSLFHDVPTKVSEIRTRNIFGRRGRREFLSRR